MADDEASFAAAQLKSEADRLITQGLEPTEFRQRVRDLNDIAAHRLAEDALAEILALYGGEHLPESVELTLAKIKHSVDVAKEPRNPPPMDIETIAPARGAPIHAFGPPGGLKSWIFLGVCRAVALGEPFAGFVTHRRDRVLYLNLDADADEVEDRIKAFGGADGFDVLTIDPEEFTLTFRQALFGRYRAGYIAIDCFSDIFEPDPKKEPGLAMRAWVRSLRKLYREYGCGGAIIDHARRQRESDEPIDFSGTVQKEATFRGMWLIEPEKPVSNPKLRRVRISCRRLQGVEQFEPFTIEVAFGDRVEIRRADTIELPTAESMLDDRVRAWAREQTRTFTRSNAVKAILGHADEKKRQSFQRLIDAGELVGDGTRGGGITYRYASCVDGPPNSAQRAQLDLSRDSDADSISCADGPPNSANMKN